MEDLTDNGRELQNLGPVTEKLPCQFCFKFWVHLATSQQILLNGDVLGDLIWNLGTGVGQCVCTVLYTNRPVLKAILCLTGKGKVHP